MRRVIASLLLLSLAGCATTMAPVSTDKTREAACILATQDPPQYRPGTFPKTHGVWAEKYWLIRQANKDCVKALILVSTHNERAAITNKAATKSRFMDGVYIGTALLAVVEFLIWIIVA